MEASLGWELGMGWGCSMMGFSVQPPKAAEPWGLLGCSSGCSSAGDRRNSGVPPKLAQAQPLATTVLVSEQCHVAAQGVVIQLSDRNSR